MVLTLPLQYYMKLYFLLIDLDQGPDLYLMMYTYDIRLIQQALTHYDFYLIERGENKMCLERSNGLQKS